ncbi:MAG TPA: hypothetical protein VGH03_02915 [Caulobacteraceae bacterium]|jgi:hypothetical protein
MKPLKPLHPIAIGLCLALLPEFAMGQAATPANDQVNCSAWATQQTGYNPAQPPPTAVANQQVAGTGSRARGAAGGAAIGAMAGNAGAGAAAGAVAGGVAQRSRARRAARQQNEAIAQQQQAGQAAYNQALSSCLAKHPAP